MSFVVPIQGFIPNSEFIYTSTNISSDNISCTNLSATNASLINLTTTTFSPVNVNASEITANQIDANIINSSTLNSSLITSNNIISDSGTINNLTAGNLNAFNVNMSYLNVSNFNANTATATTSNATTNNASTLNASYISVLNMSAGDMHSFNMSSVYMATTTLNASQNNASNVSANNIHANTLYSDNMRCINISSQNIWSSWQETTYIFFKSPIGGGSSGEIHRNGPSFYIDGGGVGAGQPGDILFSTDKINYNMSYDGNLNLSTIANLSTINSNVATVTTLTVFNTSIVNGDITNLKSNVIETDSINTSSLYFDSTDVAEPTGKIKKTNAVLEVSGGSTTNPGSIAFSTDRTNFNMTYDGASLNMNGNINASTITGDISTNLAAGTNITLSTLNGITTINSSGGGGGVIDPLNISVGNISTLNTSNSTNDGTLTTTNLIAGNITAFDSNMSYLNVSTINADNINGFIKSTQYAFQATSNAGSVPFTTGALLPFNVIEFCVPNTIAFNTTSGNFSYTCQVAGLYSIGFHLYLTNPAADTGFEIALFKNNIKFASGGSKAAFTEDVECLAQCVIGDIWTIKIVTVGGSPQIFMSATNSWFYGYLLEPTNVAINTGTDLTVQTLTADALNVSTINVSTGNFSDFNSLNLSVNNVSTYNFTTYAQSASYYYYPSDDPLYSTGTVFKTANILRLNGGNTTSPGYIALSVDNSSFPLLFNGNLNLATTFNASNVNISQCFSNITTCNLLETPLINCSTSNTSMINSSDANISEITTANAFCRFLNLPSTTPTVTSDALVYKDIAELRICAGDPSSNGNITFSQDNLSFPMRFDGNLNLETIANISTVNTSTLNVSSFGATDNLVGKSSIYSRITTSQYYPSSGTTTVYFDFDVEVYANTDLFTYVAPVGGTNEGFICQKAGYYKFDYSIVCFSATYANRVQWLCRPHINTTLQVGRAWDYTRSQATAGGYAWSCNCTGSLVAYMAASDYFTIQMRCAKNDNTLGDDFNGLGLDGGSSITLQYLGV